MTSIYQGDSWEFEYRITDKYNKPITNLSEWEIRAGIKDSAGVIKIKKNLRAGGSNAEIKVLDHKGNILITYEKEDTELIAIGNIWLEIEITSAVGKRYTVLRESFNVIDDII